MIRWFFLQVKDKSKVTITYFTTRDSKLYTIDFKMILMIDHMRINNLSIQVLCKSVVSVILFTIFWYINMIYALNFLHSSFSFV